MSLLGERYSMGTHLSSSGCSKNTMTAPYQLGEGVFINYVWCMLKKYTETEELPSIKQLLLLLIQASSIGYTFPDENQRRLHYSLVESLTEIDPYVNNHCYASKAQFKGAKAGWDLPRYPQKYCSNGRQPQVEIYDYCEDCRSYCSFAWGWACIRATNESQRRFGAPQQTDQSGC